MNFENLPELLTVREAASVCRVVPKTIYRCIWNGRLKAVRVGRNMRIPRAELLRFLGMEPQAA